MVPRQQIPIKVIVVDDDPDEVFTMCDLLRLKGFESYAVLNAADAVGTAKQVGPHAMLLDIGMPRLDGYQIARIIRADLDLREILLIAVTGYGRPVDKQLAREAGFDHHFTKPVDPDEIFCILASLNSSEAADTAVDLS